MAKQKDQNQGRAVADSGPVVSVEDQIAATKKKLRELRKSAKRANSGVPNTKEGNAVLGHVQDAVDNLLTVLREGYPDKVVRTLSIRIKDGAFEKVTGYSFVNPRGEKEKVAQAA